VICCVCESSHGRLNESGVSQESLYGAGTVLGARYPYLLLISSRTQKDQVRRESVSYKDRRGLNCCGDLGLNTVLQYLVQCLHATEPIINHQQTRISCSFLPNLHRKMPYAIFVRWTVLWRMLRSQFCVLTACAYKSKCILHGVLQYWLTGTWDYQ
jgi:hypothetical protein